MPVHVRRTRLHPDAGKRGRCDDNEDCPANHTCSASQTCLANDGHACTQNTECLITCIDGTCGQRSATLGACDDTADCVADHTCSSVTWTCRRNNGQACNFNGQCLYTCISSVCRSRAADGSSCDRSDAYDCASGNCCPVSAIIYRCYSTCGGYCSCL